MKYETRKALEKNWKNGLSFWSEEGFFKQTIKS